MDKSVVSAVGHFGSRTTADPLIMMFFFFCAVSYVSGTIEGIVHDIDLRSEGILCGAEAALPYTVIAASLERAITATGQPLTTVQASHVGWSATWRGGSSIHEGRRGLVSMAGSVSFLGPASRTWARRFFGTDGKDGGAWRTEIENDSGDRPVRRWRICGTIGRGPCKVVPTLSSNDRKFPPEEED